MAMVFHADLGSRLTAIKMASTLAKAVLPAGLEPAIRPGRAIPNRLRLPVSPRQRHGVWGGSLDSSL